LTEIFEIGLEKLPVIITWVPEAPAIALIVEMASGCTGSGMGTQTGVGVG